MQAISDQYVFDTLSGSEELYDEEAFDADEESDEEFFDEESDEEFLPLLGGVLPSLAGGVINGVRKAINPGRARSYGRNVSGNNRGTVMTPGGPLQVLFDKRYVTAEQLKNALAEVRTDVNKVSSAVTAVDKRQTSALATEARRIRTQLKSQHKKTGIALKRIERRSIAQQRALDKKLEDSKQMMLMMTLMQSPPTIERLTISEGGGVPRVVTVSDTEYESQNNMLPLLLMMGGGLGGGDSSSSMLMVLALSGALSK